MELNNMNSMNSIDQDISGSKSNIIININTGSDNDTDDDAGDDAGDDTDDDAGDNWKNLHELSENKITSTNIILDNDSFSINIGNNPPLGSEPSDTDSQICSSKKISYKKLSFNDVQTMINEYYEQDTVHRYSSAMDILASYLKGQKIIYMESRIYCGNILNLLMFPCILLTCFASIGQGRLTVVSKDNDSNQFKIGSFLLSAINGFIAFLLAIISYLKLDAISEAHKISTHQYDKLQSFVEFQSGQILLFSDPVLSKQSLQKHWEETSAIFSFLGNTRDTDISQNEILYSKKKELFDKKQIEKKKIN